VSKLSRINYRTYLRSIIAILLMIVWSSVIVSGVLLWLVPHGPRSGQTRLLFNLTKQDWGELHLWFGLAAIAVTSAHLVIDWRGLRGCMKYLTSVHRGNGSTEDQIPKSTQAKASNA
jgi:hypothetical protein